MARQCVTENGPIIYAAITRDKHNRGLGELPGIRHSGDIATGARRYPPRTSRWIPKKRSTAAMPRIETVIIAIEAAATIGSLE